LVDLPQPPVDILAVHKGLELAVLLDPPVLADAEKDDPVDRLLDRVVEFPERERRVAEGDVPGQERPPGFNLLQELDIDLLRRPPADDGFGVFVEEPFHDRLPGEDGGELVPPLDVFLIGKEQHPVFAGLVLELGADAAVVDGKLLEIGEDGEGEVGGPGVAAELVGRADIALDVHRGLLRFQEELARPADAETIIGGLGIAPDLDRILGDDVLVGLGPALPVADVPAEFLEERLDELGAELSFLIAGAFVGGEVALEDFDQAFDLLRGGHKESSKTLSLPRASWDRKSSLLYNLPPDNSILFRGRA